MQSQQPVLVGRRALAVHQLVESGRRGAGAMEKGSGIGEGNECGTDSGEGRRGGGTGVSAVCMLSPDGYPT